MSKTLNWGASDVPRPLSATLLHYVAATLQAASDMLTRHAERISAAEAAIPAAQTVEFHPIYRDAGAPEGGLYVDGILVAVIPGLTRL